MAEYLHSSFQEFEQTAIFSKKNHEEKIIMLVWLVNTFCRIKDLEQTEKFTLLLGENIHAFNEKYHISYVWMYYQSLTVVHILKKKPQLAIDNLENLANSPRYKNILSRLSLYLNLAVLYYYVGKMGESLTHFSKIILSSEFTSISPHLQLNIGIAELIFRLETEDFQYAQSKYKELRRKYRKELEIPSSKEQLDFLEILNDFIQKPAPTKQPKIITKINLFIESYSNFEIGSNELLDYSLWLESKLQNRRYYEVMLDSYFGE